MATDWDKVEFKNEKKFLSNMYPTKIVFKNEILEKEFTEFDFDGEVYNSSEHLYQALKSKNKEWHKLIRDLEEPTKTKTLARKRLSNNVLIQTEGGPFQIREDWEEGVKLRAMEMILMLKFTQSNELADKLFKYTGDIEERNSWGDRFWGTVDGIGQNNLGKLLMKTRIALHYKFANSLNGGKYPFEEKDSEWFKRSL